VPVGAAHALIGEGGPLRRLERRCRLTRPRSQILVVLAITWLPLTLGSLLTEHQTGHPSALLRDISMHVRLVVATPLLLFLDRVFPRACSHTVDQLSRTGFIKPADQDRFEHLLARVNRLSEWWLPELLLAIAALGLGIATLLVESSQGDLLRRADLSVADWWYALVALPLFEFLLLRSLWRWVTWVIALAGLSRLDLDLDATHPDRCGGISFLRKPSLAYCALVLFAASAVTSAAWSDRFQFVTIGSFVPLLLVFAAVATLVAFGPLLVFTFQLHRVKVAAAEAMGGLAARNGRWFRERWMNSADGEVLSTADVQGLAAIGSTYREAVKQLRLVLFERRDLMLVLFAALLPAVPSMLVRITHEEWLAMASFVVGTGLPL